MTLEEIYEEYTVGSQGFVIAVSDHCGGLECSSDEIKRIAYRASSAAEFRSIWENDRSWRDEENEPNPYMLDK